jgi:putative redox protein
MGRALPALGMVRMDVTYDGDLRCTATHAPSGATLVTDAPVDNHGKGESFSPTDLLATSTLTCIMTILAIRAESRGLDLNGMHGHVEKHMVGGPRRVGRLVAEVVLPDGLDKEGRAWLIADAASCPVTRSISDGLDLDLHVR